MYTYIDACVSVCVTERGMHIVWVRMGSQINFRQSWQFSSLLGDFMVFRLTFDILSRIILQKVTSKSCYLWQFQC